MLDKGLGIGQLVLLPIGTATEGTGHTIHLIMGTTTTELCINKGQDFEVLLTVVLFQNQIKFFLSIGYLVKHIIEIDIMVVQKEDYNTLFMLLSTKKMYLLQLEVFYTNGNT